MAEALCTYIENDRPFLGICLGLQLLFESSEENGRGQFSSLNFYVGSFFHYHYLSSAKSSPGLIGSSVILLFLFVIAETNVLYI